MNDSENWIEYWTKNLDFPSSLKIHIADSEGLSKNSDLPSFPSRKLAELVILLAIMPPSRYPNSSPDSRSALETCGFFIVHAPSIIKPRQLPRIPKTITFDKSSLVQSDNWRVRPTPSFYNQWLPTDHLLFIRTQVRSTPSTCRPSLRLSLRSPTSNSQLQIQSPIKSNLRGRMHQKSKMISSINMKGILRSNMPTNMLTC